MRNGEGQFLSDVKVQIDDGMSLGNSVNAVPIRIIFKRWRAEKLYCSWCLAGESNELLIRIVKLAHLFAPHLS